LQDLQAAWLVVAGSQKVSDAGTERQGGTVNDSLQMSCLQHKTKTSEDIREVIKILESLYANVQEGDLQAFEQFWIEGGTEEGDSRIESIREYMCIRYIYRYEAVRRDQDAKESIAT